MIQTAARTATKSTGRYTVWLLIGYVLLTLMFTWPTVAQLSTHLPGDGGDDPAIAWNLWWVKFALLNAGQNPFATDFMFYPLGINLAFYTLTVLNAATALPLTLNFGVTAASNLHTIFSFAVSGLGAFLLARDTLAATRPKLTASPRVLWAGAAIAGGCYAFASSKLFYVALGQFNIASSHWVPFAALYLMRMHRQPRRLKNALLAGLFLTLQTWAEMTYASFLLVLIGLYWLYMLLAHFFSGDRRNSLRGLLPHLAAAALTLAVFAAGISPILANMLPDMLAEGDFLVEGAGFADTFSADLLGFVVPTMLHPLLGGLVTQTGIAAFDKGQHIYVGFVLLALAAIAALTGWRRPQFRFWLLAALVFGLLALGPVITVNGQQTGLPGPFVLLQQLPFFKGNRYPSRYSVMLLLSLSVLAAFGLAWLGGKLRGKTAPVALAAIALLFLFEHLSAPLPQSDMRLPAAYRAIAADPAAVTVLDIPFAWRNGFRITGALTTQFMFGQFYQTAHQKPMLQGNTSRNPEFKFRYFTQAPVLNSLLALETGKQLPPDRWQSDRAFAADVLSFFNIGYIVVRPDDSDSDIVTPQATLPYIDDLFPVQKIYADDAITLYRVQPAPPPAELAITPDSPLAPLYFGEGWGVVQPGLPVAAQRKAVRLLLPLAGGPQRLTLTIQRPPQLETQQVRVTANGWSSAAQPLSAGESVISFDLPAQAVRPGLNDVWLNFERTADLPRLPPQDVTVLSAGQEVGDYGHIYVNGHEVSPNQRGYNAAIITANETRAASFDTHLDPTASAALMEFLASAPARATIALAAADEASANLSEAAVQAAGASGDLRGCFRCSHAVIRTADGRVLESLDALRPVTVSTNWGLTEPTLAALVESITIEAVAAQEATP